MTKEEYIEKRRELDASISKLEEEKKLLISELRAQYLDEYRYLIGKKVRCYGDHDQYLGEAYLSDVDICDMPDLQDVVAVFRCHACKKDGTMSQRRFSVLHIEPVEEK